MPALGGHVTQSPQGWLVCPQRMCSPREGRRLLLAPSLQRSLALTPAEGQAVCFAEEVRAGLGGVPGDSPAAHTPGAGREAMPSPPRHPGTALRDATVAQARATPPGTPRGVQAALTSSSWLWTC